MLAKLAFQVTNPSTAGIIPLKLLLSKIFVCYQTVKQIKRITEKRTLKLEFFPIKKT